MATKWYELGLELLDDSQAKHLDIISANSPDVTRCCREMFKHWLNAHPTASWYKLVDALRATGIEENTVAGMLESNFAV